MTKLTLGADPEILVVRGGKISHCIGLLGGTKEAPIKVDGGALQEDNVLFEFNIDPCETYTQFTARISQVIAQGCKVLGDEFSLSDKSSHIFSKEEMSMFPESAFVFGCDPDYNALTGLMNPKPAADPGLRTAGGHVHFGVKDMLKAKGVEMTENTQRELMVLADYFLGIPSLILDSDDKRRLLYGKAGAMRFKDYGAEYRTLSNFWIHSEENRRFVWDQSLRVVEQLDNIREIVAQVPPQVVQQIINNSDRKAAEQLMKRIKLV